MTLGPPSEEEGTLDDDDVAELTIVDTVNVSSLLDELPG